MLRIPTIWVAIGQGLAGTMPWVIMGLFFITWLVNDRGLDESLATIAFAGIVVGTVISNIMGGFIGDYAEKINPNYGRIVIGQFSVLTGIPLTYLLLTGTEDWSFPGVVVLCVITALFISWPGKGSKEPMMQSVVPPELRSLAYSSGGIYRKWLLCIGCYFCRETCGCDWVDQSDGVDHPGAMDCLFRDLYRLLFYIPQRPGEIRGQMSERAKEIV